MYRRLDYVLVVTDFTKQMLQRKKKICKCCNTEQYIFSKGCCEKCSKGNATLQSSGFIKKTRQKTVDKKQETRELRNVYFEYHISRCTHSQESGQSIPNPTRSNICHIFDKSRHPSLQDNLENCILLTQSEHERFDKLLFSLEFEKLEVEFKNSWNNTLILVKKLLNLCEENTVFTRAIKKYLDGRGIES